MSTIDPTTTVGELVAERPARSRVFQSLGIDFCCGGKKPLAEACAAQGLDAETVAKTLAAAETGAGESGPDPASMGLAELCDHIEQAHHRHLDAELPRLQQMADRVATVHGQAHPWTQPVADTLRELTAELMSHMMKEEQVLFPAIRAIEAGDRTAASHCGGVENPIRMMEMEHENAGSLLANLRELTGDYTAPEGACNTFRALIDGLEELEHDMHQHIHKENNVLFPRAAAAQNQAPAAVQG